MTGIYRMHLDGSEVQNLSQNFFRDNKLQISPDGQSVIFDLWGDINTDLYRMGLDGKEIKNLTQSPSASEFFSAFTPDNQWIIVNQDNG